MNAYEAKLRRFQQAIAAADWPRALKAVDGLIKEHPNGVSLHYNRGLVLKHLDHLPEALRAFECTVALDPNHSHACFERGLALFNLGRFGEAAAVFQQYLVGSPDDADAVLNLGIALLHSGDVKEARQQLRIAHDLAASVQTTIAMATAERDCGDVEAMEQLIAELPDDEPEIAAVVLKLRTQGAYGRLSLYTARV